MSAIKETTAAPVISHDDEKALLAYLGKKTETSEFARSLMKQHMRKGALSFKQWEAAAKMLKKDEQGEPEGNPKLASLVATMVAIGETKAKKPRFKFDGFTLSLASHFSKNAGYAYVKEAEGLYAGKISPEGKFFPTSAAPEGLAAAIEKVSADPLLAAKDFGRKTGICSCCGRKLTDPKSVEAGIGPVCAKYF